MSLKSWAQRIAIKRYLGRNPDMKQKFDAVVTWLNAVPGRKRGIAAALLGIAEVLRVYGHSDYAEITDAINGVIQGYVVPGCDMTGFIFAIVGLVHAKKKGQL